VGRVDRSGVEWRVDFNAEGTEFAEKRRRDRGADFTAHRLKSVPLKKEHMKREMRGLGAPI